MALTQTLQLRCWAQQRKWWWQNQSCFSWRQQKTANGHKVFVRLSLGSVFKKIRPLVTASCDVCIQNLLRRLSRITCSQNLFHQWQHWPILLAKTIAESTTCICSFSQNCLEVNVFRNTDFITLFLKSMSFFFCFLCCVHHHNRKNCHNFVTRVLIETCD